MSIWTFQKTRGFQTPYGYQRLFLLSGTSLLREFSYAFLFMILCWWPGGSSCSLGIAQFVFLAIVNIGGESLRFSCKELYQAFLMESEL